MALVSVQGLSDQDHNENCDERSLLIFKTVLTSRRTCITEENLEKVVIVIRNSRRRANKRGHDCCSVGNRAAMSITSVMPKPGG